MYTRNRILGVHGGSINVDPVGDSNVVAARAVRANMMPVTANMGYGGLGLGGGSGASSNVNSFWASNYQYMMTGILPADPGLTDTANLKLFYRDIYLFDSTAGSAIDIQSHFPFSDWELRGLTEKELAPFNETLMRLNIRQMLPLISTAYLVDGFFCGSMVFDPRSRQFMDTLIHDALSCNVLPSSFFCIDPEISVTTSQATQQMLHSASEYTRRYLDSMPQSFVNQLRDGSFTLDPVTMLYVARRSTTDRASTSYLHRILPMYLIEKTLFRGTLTEAQRRQRAMTHLTAGDDKWTPTGEELNALVRTFQQAEYDPLGGWVSTRNAVQAVDIRPGGDFWRWYDTADVLVPYKLRAMGISEAFMEGDTSYAAAESAYSSFLETQNSYRQYLTDSIFYSKIFPLVAVINDLYKDPKKRAQTGHVVDFLFNKGNRQNLKMPQLHWHKKLEVKGEENMMEMLELASEKGVPVPLKMWMAAAQIDPEALDRDLKEDRAYRAMLQKYTGKDTSFQAETENINSPWVGKEGGWGHGGPRSDRDEMEDRGIERAEEPELRALFERTAAGNRTSESFNLNSRGYRQPLLAREFEGDSWTLTKTGKIKHNPNPVNARRQMNDNIYKIAKRATRDPNYRAELKKRNIEKRGSAVLRHNPALKD